MESIQELAQRWIEQDQDEGSRRQISDLLASNNGAELENRLRTRIAFGTAGLRSSMQAGFAYMNALTVIQASQGLAQYILDQCGRAEPSQQDLSIVVGYDARHNSEKFARHAAAAFLSKGFKVLWFGALVHTPMVPFVVKTYHAAGGVMITASHNPKRDNGYKVYSVNGCQIIPPHDVGIAAAIEHSYGTSGWDLSAVDESPQSQIILEKAKAAYFEAIEHLLVPSGDEVKVPKFSYTPMHGVGLPFMQEAIRRSHISRESMSVVLAQAAPDPEFSTVPFPNPEEKGALDLALEDAQANGNNFVIANDPDADRFAAAERLEDGRWHQFTGNQMGVLLASYVLETRQADGRKIAMLASTVSSRMLATIAQREGFHFRETLTGFKWLGNVAQTLSREGYEPVFAYEEAIGYMFPSVVWDKDGIAAAIMFLTAAAMWQKQGKTPYAKLQELYAQYGYYHDANTYLLSPSPEVTNKVFADIRALEAGSRPTRLGKRKILRWRDLTLGYDSGTADGKPELPVDASAQMVTCEVGDVVFTARGSGTEPKIKLYIEATASSFTEAKVLANEVLQDLLKEWFGPQYSLRLAGT